MIAIGEATKAWAERAGIEAYFEPEMPSTNDRAKADTDSPRRSPLAPVLYVTNHQTQGRGRGGNSWSDAGGTLLSSWSFHATKPPQPIFSPLAGLAVFRALKAVWPTLDFSLKAPNDIYLGEKKLAGLLIETIDAGATRRTIVGLGLNVLSTPPEVDTATSLATAVGGAVNITSVQWGQFLQKLMLAFISALSAGQNQSLLQSDGAELLAALNARVGLAEKILKVGPQGELHTAGGIIRWQDL